MASSAHKQQKFHLPNIYVGANSAPPPTPSTSHPSASASATADALSRLLNRLPSPTLSLPNTRGTRSPSSTRPPIISLSNPNDDHRHFLSSASQLGFFQLTHHNIPSQLARSAEREAISLFDLEKDQKLSCFPKNWPLGYEADDEDGEGNGESFCLDSSCSSESTTELSLTSLREFTRAMEKIGLKIVEMLASAVGFMKPFGGDDPTRYCSFLWMSKNLHGNNPALSGGFYPYVVGLHYQIRARKHTLLADSGSVPVSAQVDSILVTLGDIAQVWSNGKTKKVRSGRPMGDLGEEKIDKSASSDCVSMILLVTLPIDSVVSPRIHIPNNNLDDDAAESTDRDSEDIEGQISHGDKGGAEDEEEAMERRVFESFSFEDYAWRVYHERLLFNDDPLDRYRI